MFVTLSECGFIRYLSTYPDVHLDICVVSGAIDIVAKGFDAGIGSKVLAAADMIAVRVMGPTKVVVVGAPFYFEQPPPPRTPDDLARHNCVQFRLPRDDSLLEWPFDRNGSLRHVKVKGRVTVNEPGLAVRAALDGLGLATAGL
jgi:DNA-binding transcriptional LysR family regulator